MSFCLSCRYGCANSIHIKCMKIWADHQVTMGEKVVKCPFCREDFGSIDYLKEQYRNTVVPHMAQSRTIQHPNTVCRVCNQSPIEGKCYRWGWSNDWPSFHCQPLITWSHRGLLTFSILHCPSASPFSQSLSGSTLRRIRVHSSIATSYAMITIHLRLRGDHWQFWFFGDTTLCFLPGFHCTLWHLRSLSYGKAAGFNTCFFHQWEFSAEHHVWVSIMLQVWGLST